jgi:hypothetical protein
MKRGDADCGDDPTDATRASDKKKLIKEIARFSSQLCEQVVVRGHMCMTSATSTNVNHRLAIATSRTYVRGAQLE